MVLISYSGPKEVQEPKTEKTESLAGCYLVSSVLLLLQSVESPDQTCAHSSHIFLTHYCLLPTASTGYGCAWPFDSKVIRAQRISSTELGEGKETSRHALSSKFNLIMPLLVDAVALGQRSIKLQFVFCRRNKLWNPV